MTDPTDSDLDPSLDSLLKCRSVVHVLRLPIELNITGQSASYLDKAYSAISENFFKNHHHHVHRYQGIKQASSSASELIKRKRLSSDEELKAKGLSQSHPDEPTVIKVYDDQSIYNQEFEMDNQMAKSSDNLSDQDDFAESLSDITSSSGEYEIQDPRLHRSTSRTINSISRKTSARESLDQTELSTIRPFPEYRLIPWHKPKETEGPYDYKLIPLSPVQSSPSETRCRASTPFETLSQSSCDETPEPIEIDYSSLLESDDGEIQEITPEMDFGQLEKPKHQHKERKEVPFNWLDVSKLKIKYYLIVEIANGGSKFIDGDKVKSIFLKVYNQFGKYPSTINRIRTCCDYIELSFDDQQTRTKIKNELDEIIEMNRKNEVYTKTKDRLRLKVRIPDLKLPQIFYVSDVPVSSSNCLKVTEKIKKLNQWPEGLEVTWVKTVSKNRAKFKIILKVDSRVRTMIEERNGLMLINKVHAVEVFDDFNLVVCFRCLKFNHTSNSCDSQDRCYFCYRNCRSFNCSERNRPRWWYCGICQVTGHSTISIECPSLLEILKPKLEHIDHKYTFIFFEPSSGLRYCHRVLTRKGLTNKRETDHRRR